MCATVEGRCLEYLVCITLASGPNTKSDVFVLLYSRQIHSDITQFSVTRFGFFNSESGRTFFKNRQKMVHWQTNQEVKE